MANEEKFGLFDQLYKRIEGETVNGEPAFAPVVFAVQDTSYSTDEASVVIELPHHEVHEGNTYSSWVYTGTVANNGTIDLVVSTTGTADGMHCTWLINAGGSAVSYLYEGTTGTFSNPAPVYNLNRESANVSGIVCHQYPSISVLGTLLSTILIPGGAGGNARGATARQDTEWIFAPGKRYLIRAQNIAGTAQAMSITVQWYQL